MRQGICSGLADKCDQDHEQAPSNKPAYEHIAHPWLFQNDVATTGLAAVYLRSFFLPVFRVRVIRSFRKIVMFHTRTMHRETESFEKIAKNFPYLDPLPI